MNAVHILVRLAADPEVRFTPGGQAVCNFRGAYTEKWTSKEGEKKEKTSWLRFSAWGKTGEFIGQYFGKGGLILVEGKLETREWDDKEGKKQVSTEVVVDRAHFAGNSGKEKGAAAPKREEKQDSNEDIPF